MGVCRGGCDWRGSGSGEDCPAGHLHRNSGLFYHFRQGFRQQHGHSERFWRQLRITLLWCHSGFVFIPVKSRYYREFRWWPSNHGRPDKLQLPGGQRNGVSVFSQGEITSVWIFWCTNLHWNWRYYLILPCFECKCLCLVDSAFTEIWQPETSFFQKTMWWRFVTLVSLEMSTKTRTMSAKETWVLLTDTPPVCPFIRRTNLIVLGLPSCCKSVLTHWSWDSRYPVTPFTNTLPEVHFSQC